MNKKITMNYVSINGNKEYTTKIITIDYDKQNDQNNINNNIKVIYNIL